jgi:hypothetical protein
VLWEGADFRYTGNLLWLGSCCRSRLESAPSQRRNNQGLVVQVEMLCAHLTSEHFISGICDTWNYADVVLSWKPREAHASRKSLELPLAGPSPHHHLFISSRTVNFQRRLERSLEPHCGSRGLDRKQAAVPIYGCPTAARPRVAETPNHISSPELIG